MPPEHQIIERELRFTLEDMDRFAAGSGDFSPLHMDADWARRTAFGERIIHGGLLTIAMLGLLPAEALGRVRSISSTYPGPVLPDQACLARAREHPSRPGEWEIRLTGRGKLLARVLAGPKAAAMLEQSPAEDAIAGEYRAGDELVSLALRFGSDALDPRLLDGIGWASHVVGMTIPAFDGLCAAVTLLAPASGRAPGASQWVRIREHDERTDRMVIEGVLSDAEGSPACRGEIECFPFSPTPLPASAAIGRELELEPPRGRVVIVGGSRGLGGALALAWLARGYAVDVIFARSRGSSEELRVLAGAYAERLELHQLDAADPEAIARCTREIGGPIDGLALCAAPPPLPLALTPDSAGELEGYVARTLALSCTPAAAFLPLLRPGSGWVLFCSAGSAAEPEREYPQFAAAKSAVEGFARWLAASSAGVRVAVARLPRMRTDLVNTPSARAAATAPEHVAGALVERLADDEPVPGLSVLEPGLGVVAL